MLALLMDQSLWPKLQFLLANYLASLSSRMLLNDFSAQANIIGKFQILNKVKSKNCTNSLRLKYTSSENPKNQFELTRISFPQSILMNPYLETKTTKLAQQENQLKVQHTAKPFNHLLDWHLAYECNHTAEYVR